MFRSNLIKTDFVNFPKSGSVKVKIFENLKIDKIQTKQKKTSIRLFLSNHTLKLDTQKQQQNANLQIFNLFYNVKTYKHVDHNNTLLLVLLQDNKH